MDRNSHLCKLAQYVIQKLAVDMSPADFYVRGPELDRDSVLIIIGYPRSEDPDDPFSEEARSYAEGLVRDLPKVFQSAEVHYDAR